METFKEHLFSLKERKTSEETVETVDLPMSDVKEQAKKKYEATPASTLLKRLQARRPDLNL